MKARPLGQTHPPRGTRGLTPSGSDRAGLCSARARFRAIVIRSGGRPRPVSMGQHVETAARRVASPFYR